MSYFKRLTSQQQLPQSSVFTFTQQHTSHDFQEESFDEFPEKSHRINIPRASIRPQRMKSKIAVYLNDKHSVFDNNNYPPKTRPISPISQNYTKLNTDQNQYLQRHTVQVQTTQIPYNHNTMRNSQVSKVSYSMNTSPKQYTEKQDIVYSQEFFKDLVEMMKKFNEKNDSHERRQQQFENCKRCSHQEFYRPQHQQAPVIINNIIKPSDYDYRSHQVSQEYHEKPKQIYIDQELQEQQNRIRRLEQERKRLSKRDLESTIQFNSEIIKMVESVQPKFISNRLIAEKIGEDDKSTFTSFLNAEQYSSEPTTTTKNRQKRQFNRPEIKVTKKQSIYLEQKQAEQKSIASIKISQSPNRINNLKPVFFELPVNENANKNVSLAEAFMKRKGFQNADKSKQKRPSEKSTQKTKQELAQIRKDMMKKKSIQIRQPIEPKPIIMDTSISKNSSARVKKQPSQQLLQRLISGTKPKLEERQFKALTKKNYNQLPQVKKKKEQQRKKQQFQKRMQMKKQYESSLRSTK